MPTPHEKLALSLEQLNILQLQGQRIFRSSELTRVHRERLLKSGFLKEVMKGWLMSWNPDASPGAPISNRLKVIWEQSRKVVVDVFQEAPGLPKNPNLYLKAVDDSYITDAYHSLSIEGYRVTPSLIEKVRLGNWDPEGSGEDRENYDALSARGYWQAYQEVRQVVDQILRGKNAAELVQKEFRNWHRELFQPMVTAGLIPASTLAGFRNSPVLIKGSRHVPPRNEIVIDAMTTLFEILQNETEASVRAVMGHWLIGYIHPYLDGNGRIARFFMNAMLASGGYPWTIVPVDKRETYMHALEIASVDQDIMPFAQFIADCMKNPIQE